MITKGHDVSGVTLVGALLADLSLNLPDFRAAERTFQLLSQVGGRSWRGDNPGRVIVQTYAPDHYAIQHLVRHDYKNFFAAESEFRQALNYPPFSRLVNLRIDGPKLSEVEENRKSWRCSAKGIEDDASPRCSRKSKCWGRRPRRSKSLEIDYRWQLLLRGKQKLSFVEFARQARQLAAWARRAPPH